jgi:Rrf2 family nitric oxide-sensitive transcriptional repressor
MTVFIKREYDYAIRIVAYVANFYPDKHVSVPEIAKQLFLTVPFTTKIVHQLKKGKIVDTVQGKYGGIKLKKSPDKISFYNILNAMGFDITINECLKNPTICPLVSDCKIHRFFDKQEMTIVDNLKSALISDFIITDQQLSKS